MYAATTRKRKQRVLTSLQLCIAIGLPVIAVLSSMTVSLFQISGIREDIREIRSDIKIMTGKIADIDTRLTLIEDRWKIRP
jgi:hypothetical protein